MAAICPQDGDLVVRSEEGPRNQPVFIVSRIGALWETTCATYAEAVDVAERTARIYKSDIWLTKDGAIFDLVSSLRENL
jgi:hypothetical protein